MNQGRKPTTNTLLMVGPIPVRGSYIGGIGVLIKQILAHWDVPSASVIHFNPEFVVRPYGTTGQLRLRNLLLCVVNLVRLFHSMLRTRPHLVHYHTSRGLALFKDMMFAACLRGLFELKVILHINSSDARTILMFRTPRLQRLQVRVLQRCCDRLVLLSHNVLDDLAGILGPKAAAQFRSRCTVLHNFAPVPRTLHQHREPAGGVCLFYIGNIGREKGIYDTLEAARRLCGRTAVPFRVVLAGPFNDPQEEQLVCTTVAQGRLEETVVFLGPVFDQRKEDAFLQADIFVLPSYSEGIPLSMLEAMAYGLPVVVSNVGGIPEVVRDGQEGRIIQPGDVDGLCGALRGLMESVALREKMGAAARHRIETHFTIDNYMRQLQRMYSSLLGLGGDSGGPPKEKQAES